MFITGHTGFKGSWLALWLKSLGAEVAGYALAPSTSPNHLDVLSLEMHSVLADIRNKERIAGEIQAFHPDIVFHLAAQPLVRYSYAEPSETYETNVMGTLNVFEACRSLSSVKAIVCVTTDKVYENIESTEGYVETDRLGGYDPYSGSKACTEILTHSYVSSFFNLKDFGTKHNTLISTARGGNVIGGADWSKDRLIPDIVCSVKEKRAIELRNPLSIRPWQHVLDCLSGYLLLGCKLMEGNKKYSGPWNFGPIETDLVTVKNIVQIAKKYFPSLSVKFGEASLYETETLQLNCNKAYNQLNWKPIWGRELMFEKTFEWYKEFYSKKKVNTEKQLEDYLKAAVKESLTWTK